MSSRGELYWLPAPPDDWRRRLQALAVAASDEGGWKEAIALANHRLNFQLTNALASIVAQRFGAHPPSFLQSKPERLAILSSSTTTHLLPALQVGALRRGIWLQIYENQYGQYRQELLDKTSPLWAFSPTTAMFVLDAEHVAGAAKGCTSREEAAQRVEQFVGSLEQLWRLASDGLACNVLQQTIMPRLTSLIGSNEHRYPVSPSAFVALSNARLRPAADAAGVDLVGLDALVARDGLAFWHNRPHWLKAKQEIALPAAPTYADVVGRILAAKQGRAHKCLVLDLDNTLWGGVVGDDGIEGIVVGQGSALGEAFLAVQAHARALRQRGIILAACSKNDEDVARRALADHPEMILKHADFACFKANWDDKAANLRAIAKELNIGLDSLVFVDDNPFERELVRRELPMVAVPEIAADPEAIPACLADAGYFEALALTEEDFARSDYYNRPRLLPGDAPDVTDLAGYLADLDMTLRWGRVDHVSLGRTVQLINKTNQFNLTTRRYSEPQVRTMIEDPAVACLQLRLVDRFGDNGIIAVVIGRLRDDTILELDTWLMSCRVLGRQVEEATLNVVADVAQKMGARALLGIFRPTSKNGMVSGHYGRLGFAVISDGPEQHESILELRAFAPRETAIRLSEVSP
jgi:FkbH-like protein